MCPAKVKRKVNKALTPGQGLFVQGSLLGILFAVAMVFMAMISNREASFMPISPTNSSTTNTNPSVIYFNKTQGLQKAPVTVVVYSDFQCHFCQEFALGIEKQLESTYIAEGKIRLEYRHLIAYGDESGLAAEAAECAAEQNLFWPYHDLLMQLRLSNTTPDLTIEKLLELAQQLGLNMDTFSTSLTSHRFLAKIRQEDANGRELGFDALPTFFINGVKADDSIGKSFEEFQKVIDKELARLGK